MSSGAMKDFQNIFHRYLTGISDNDNSSFEKTLNTCYFTKYTWAIGENQKGLNVQTHEQSDQKSSSFLQR